MNHIKKSFYLMCISTSILCADNPLTKECEELKKELKNCMDVSEKLSMDQEVLFEEIATLQVGKEEFKARNDFLTNKVEKLKKQLAGKAESVQPVESALLESEPSESKSSESKKSYIERAKEKMKSLLNKAKNVINRE